MWHPPEPVQDASLNECFGWRSLGLTPVNTVGGTALDLMDMLMVKLGICGLDNPVVQWLGN